MKKSTLPTMSMLVATTIGIASVATPVSATPGYFAGMVGSVCAATQNNFSKITVFNNGAVANKSTAGPAIVNCAFPVEAFTNATIYVSWAKKDSQSLSCILHRRSFDYLSGATSSQNSTFNGTSSFQFNVLTDYFNSVQCTIPRNNGSGQNAVNGVLYVN